MTDAEDRDPDARKINSNEASEGREAKYAALGSAIQQGVDSGEPEKLDLEKFLARKRRVGSVA